MMGRVISALARDRRGAAAVEMAMVVPLLIVIMFGTFELGNYFYNNHIVIKGVRDGARYASRAAFTDYTCPATVEPGVVSATRNVTRTGQVAAGGTPRLHYWTNAATVDVTLECTDNAGATYAGVYEGHAKVPVVHVRATVPYVPLVGSIGLKNVSSLQIVSESEVPVMGI